MYIDTADPCLLDVESKRDMRHTGEWPPASDLRASDSTDRAVGGAIVLGHELGHILTGELDENEGGRNVQLNENPVRAHYSVSPRESYGGVPFTATP